MMAGFDGRILGYQEIWSVVHYLRALARGDVTATATVEAVTKTRPKLDLADYARMPITADTERHNTRPELARVNFMREEPGGRRFFVNDLNGPLYILDKAHQDIRDVPRLQRPRGAAGAVPEVHVPAQLRHGPDQCRLRSGLRAQRHVLHDPHGRSDIDTPAEPKPGVTRRWIFPRIGRRRRSRRRPAGGRFDREAVIVEWTDSDITNTTFEGTARELLRLELPHRSTRSAR